MASPRASDIPGEAPDVATATRWQMASVVDTLSAAFVDDPFLCWVFPDPARRADQVRALWERTISRRPGWSRVWQADDVAAAALWHAPAEGTSSEATDDFERWFRELVGNDMLAAERFRLFGSVVAQQPRDPHWYLAVIGTHPDRQGVGLGRALVERMLVTCDAEAMPAYLESTNPANVGFYQQFGFCEVGAIELPDGTSRLTLMRRPPGA